MHAGLAGSGQQQFAVIEPLAQRRLVVDDLTGIDGNAVVSGDED